MNSRRVDTVIAGLLIAIGVVAFLISLFFADLTGNVPINGKYTDEYLLNHPPAGWETPDKKSSSYFIGMMILLTVFAIAFLSIILARKLKEIRSLSQDL